MADRSGYIGRAPGDSSIIVARQTHSPTGVQTDFTFASGYTVGYIDAYLNGIRLINAEDYTATDGTTVGLTSAANNGDILELVAYKAFNLANVAESAGNFSVGNNLTVTDNLTVSGDATSIVNITGTAGTFTNLTVTDQFTGNATGTAATFTTITATDQFSGNISGVAATFTGPVTIGGTLTYEDATNVDSVGLVTARTGVRVTEGGLVVNAGVSTFSSAIAVTGVATATALGGYHYLRAPFGATVNFSVTVASKTAAHRYNGSGSANAYVIDGIQSPFLTLTPGRTYRFTMSSSDMTNHPFRFYLEAAKGTEYTTDVTTAATYTEITVTDSTPQILHYQCSSHSLMGNSVQVNSNIAGGLTGTPNIDVATGSFTGDVDIADKIVHTGDTNTAIRFPADDTITAETGGSERVRITGIGSVGIGTDNPGTKLDVRGGNWSNGDIIVGEKDNAGRIKFARGADGSDTGSIGFVAADSNSVLSMNVASGDGTLTFQTNSTEKLRITSSGLVGIGTDNPSSILHLLSSGNAATTHQTSDDGSSVSSNYQTPNRTFYTGVDIAGINSSWTVYDGIANAERLRINSVGEIGIDNTSPESYASDGRNLVIGNSDSNSASGISLVSGTGGYSNLYFADGTSGTALYSGTINYNHSENRMDFWTNGERRLRIDSAGNIGIGVTNPTSFGPTLQVSGTDPALILQDTATAVDYFAMNIASGAVNTWYDDASAFVINTASGISGAGLVERLRITSAGNVGIATDPSYEFHVRGAGTVAYFQGTGGNGFIGLEDADDSTIGFMGVDGGDILFQTMSDSYADKLVIKKDGLIWSPSSNTGAGNTDRGFYHGYSSPDTQSTGMVMKCLGIGGGSGPFDTGVSVNAGNAGGVALLFATRNTSAGTATDGAVYLMQFYYNGDNTPLVVHLGGDNWVTWGQTAGNNLEASWSGVSNYSFGMIMLQ